VKGESRRGEGRVESQDKLGQALPSLLNVQNKLGQAYLSLIKLRIN
jgi:hypothetical protein